MCKEKKSTPVPWTIVPWTLLRQVIMVTHNANLAVCCDAEQIVHASFDKANQSKVTYRSVPIEDPEINRLVVDVLEGTQPAFNNRRTKYQSLGS